MIKKLNMYISITFIKRVSVVFMPFAGSFFCFIMFFLYGLVNNLSMSYMGNTSESVSKFILDNFLGEILLFLGKLFLSYLVIALLISVLITFASRSYFKLRSRVASPRNLLIINIALTILFVAEIFFRDIILYPQIYMNNFHNKSIVHSALFEFLTDRVNPAVFTVIIWLFVLAAIGLIAAAGFRYYRKFFYIGAGVGSSAILIILIASADFGKSSRLQATQKNVIIFASDALRPDHMSGLGYKRDTTPSIDRLIKKGTSFTNAYIEVPRTFPSWVSALTGEYSATHGIRHMFPTSRDVNRDFRSIVKTAGSNGYQTSVVTDYAGDIFTRIDLGFQNVDTPYFNSEAVIQQAIIENHPFILPFLTNRAGLIIFPVLRDSAYFCPPSLLKDRILRAISKSGDRPFFITTFFSSTHFPYAPPYPYYARYAKKGYDGPYKYYKQRIISLDNNGESASAMKAEDIEQVRALYDAGIRAMDDSVGEIISYLEKHDYLKNTIIVILSDHGENLYEHEYGMGHGEHFRGRYAIKIPLVIIDPAKKYPVSSVNKTVRQVDIAPTLLSMLGLPASPRAEGRSLIPLMNGEKEESRVAFGETGIWFDNSIRDDLFFQKKRILYSDITALSELDFDFDSQIVLNDSYRDVVNLAKHRYAFDGRYKLIYMPMSDHIEYELYDTLKDPEERVNIANKDSVQLARMKKILFDWVGRNNDVIIKNEYIFPILRY